MKEYETLKLLIRLGRNLKNETERVPVCPSEKLASAYLEASEEISQLEGRIQELRTQRLSFLAKLPELMKFPKGGSRSTPTGEVTARAELLNIEEFLDKGLRQILRERRSGSLSDSGAERRWTNLLHDGFDFWEPSSATGRALLNIQKLTKRIILDHTALCRWREHLRLLEVIAEEKTVLLPHTRAEEAPPSHLETATQKTQSSGAENVFRKDGLFTVKYAGGKTFHLNNLDGCHYIVHLLGQPDHEFDCIDLVHALNKGSVAPHPEQSPDTPDLNASPWEAVDQAYDEPTRKAVSRKIKELEAEAGICTDPHETLLKREKIEELREYLRSGSSPSGKPRRTESALEKARTNVRKRIKAVLDKISKEDSALHKHLDSSIKTGASCSYRPEKSIRWEL